MSATGRVTAGLTPAGAAGSVRRVAGIALPPMVLGAVLIGAWQALVDGFGIKSWILSSPSEIWRQLTSLFSGIVTATENTGLNAIVGLVVGVALAVLLAGLCTRLRALGHAVTPVVGALAAVPAAGPVPPPIMVVTPL